MKKQAKSGVKRTTLWKRKMRVCLRRMRSCETKTLSWDLCNIPSTVNTDKSVPRVKAAHETPTPPAQTPRQQEPLEESSTSLSLLRITPPATLKPSDQGPLELDNQLADVPEPLEDQSGKTIMDSQLPCYENQDLIITHNALGQSPSRSIRDGGEVMDYPNGSSKGVDEERKEIDFHESSKAVDEDVEKESELVEEQGEEVGEDDGEQMEEVVIDGQEGQDDEISPLTPFQQRKAGKKRWQNLQTTALGEIAGATYKKTPCTDIQLYPKRQGCFKVLRIWHSQTLEMRMKSLGRGLILMSFGGK